MSGSEFHKTGAVYLNEILPYLDDFTCGICNTFLDLYIENYIYGLVF
jgi:hypothetical protein